jgi:hypothetical protein
MHKNWSKILSRFFASQSIIWVSATRTRRQGKQEKTLGCCFSFFRPRAECKLSEEIFVKIGFPLFILGQQKHQKGSKETGLLKTRLDSK